MLQGKEFKVDLTRGYYHAVAECSTIEELEGLYDDVELDINKKHRGKRSSIYYSKSLELRFFIRRKISLLRDQEKDKKSHISD